MSANDFASLDHPKYFYQLFLPPPELDSNTSRDCGPHDYRGGWGKPFLPLFPIWSRQSTILFFYGNGETAVDYDEIAPCYSQIGVNFSSPTISATAPAAALPLMALCFRTLIKC